jgi:phospholipid N-methyltransferase
MNLNKLTIEFYNKATLTDRKANGQYMTSSDIVSKSLTIEVDKNKPILEPSCGTGQFIDCLVAQGYTNITAVEKDIKVYDMVKSINNIKKP